MTLQKGLWVGAGDGWEAVVSSSRAVSCSGLGAKGASLLLSSPLLLANFSCFTSASLVAGKNRSMSVPGTSARAQCRLGMLET